MWLPMHAKLKVLLVLLMAVPLYEASAATLSMDSPLRSGDISSFKWPLHTVQEVAAGERKILVVCKSTGSGLVRRYCFIYDWSADTSEWLPVVAFRSSTSRVDAAFLEGKIVLTSYGGKVLLELTAETL